MGDTPDRIDPSGIPTFTGNLPELEKHIAGLRGDASKVRKTGVDTHTEFQKLSSFYKAPEADQLFATTQPVRDTADRFADDLTAVASALEGYATEVRPIKEKLDRLRAEAVAFVEDIEDDDDWRYDGDKVDKNNDLVKDVSATVAQFCAAERAAANKITSLVNGGTVWPEDDGSGAKIHVRLQRRGHEEGGRDPLRQGRRGEALRLGDRALGQELRCGTASSSRACGEPSRGSAASSDSRAGRRSSSPGRALANSLRGWPS